MGRSTETVFVEGHSHDDTFSAIEKSIAAHPERRCQLLKQTGAGKEDAVRAGFARFAKGILPAGAGQDCRGIESSKRW